MEKNPGILKEFKILLEKHGHQGWWPVTHEGERPTYHPKKYTFPRTEEQKWEICMGAILTQNTNWKNAEKALLNLKEAGIHLPWQVNELKTEKLAGLVRSSGYYNQKALKLKELAKLAESFGGLKIFLKNVSREELLKTKGIGPETADSILLYAGKRPFFVVDAYTKRLFGGRLFPESAGYEEIRETFEKGLPRDYRIYNEFHALIVREGKKYNSRNLNK